MARPSLEINDSTRATLAARLEELGWGPPDVSRKTSDPAVSDTTVRALLYGTRTSFSEASLRSISRALGWPPNGIARVVRGERPAAFEQERRPDAPEDPSTIQPPGPNAQPASRSGLSLEDATPDERAALEEILRLMRRDRGEG